jgi:hypothetical protein
MPWDETVDRFLAMAGPIGAAYELEGNRLSGKLRVVARCTAPDGIVQICSLPKDIKFGTSHPKRIQEVPGGLIFHPAFKDMKVWFSEEWKGNEVIRLFAYRPDVDALCPSAEQPITPVVGSNPRGAKQQQQAGSQKQQLKGGRPSMYEYDSIRSVMDEALARGPDNTKVAFYERVHNMCSDLRPKVLTPPLKDRRAWNRINKGRYEKAREL